jgi:hypothetical protein
MLSQQFMTTKEGRVTAKLEKKCGAICKVIAMCSIGPNNPGQSSTGSFFSG